MHRTARTFAEAQEIAIELRAINRGTDWTVRIEDPRFAGDLWHIYVE